MPYLRQGLLAEERKVFTETPTVIFVLALTIAPCSFSDLQHYDRAQEYHEHAAAMHDYAETEIQDCACACGPCAVHAVELARDSEEWAIRERAELNAISPECRESL